MASRWRWTGWSGSRWDFESPYCIAGVIANYARSGDPFSGEPFRYGHDANGYRFWSIGANLEDDGGRPAPFTWERPEGDIVWETGALTPVFISRNAQD